MLNGKRVCLAAAVIIFMVVFAAGCGGEAPPEETAVEGEDVRIVTSINILADIAGQILGEHGTVDYLVPLGDNPEDYELIPSDFIKITDADLIFLNGWGLEEGIERAVESISGGRVVYVTAGITPIPLVGEAGNDPHAWLDPVLVIIYVENILDALVETDPQREKEYRQNAQTYISELRELDEWIINRVKDIPESNRVLVISENALKYFGAAYGFRTEGIWELNAHEEGTPQQISRIVDLVAELALPAVFRESTLDGRYIERISRETGVPIAGEIYTDGLGAAGSGAETYIEMMKHNVDVFAAGLGS